MHIRGKHGLSLAQQVLFLRSNPIIRGSGSIKDRTLVWSTEVQPTPISRTYKVVIQYRHGNAPAVSVQDPELSQLAPGRDIPHVYHGPLRLCLYLPGSGEWTTSSRIDNTIVPWTYLWLLYFEHWLATDNWKGGGQHPGDQPKSPANRHLRRVLARL